MAQRLNRAQFEANLRAAQRKVQSEVDRVNRENRRRVEEHNRKVRQHNARVTQEAQRKVDAYNREVQRVNEHNKRVSVDNAAAVAEANRRLRAGSGRPSFTSNEQVLADRIQAEATKHPDRKWDAFLSYARIDGADVAQSLRTALEKMGVSVWFDELTITPGQSQSLQMDRGLRSARCGIALLTPAYLAGRFWTERELGALLHKRTLIPVLHNVTFEQVAEYSGILPDLAGFETCRDTTDAIAEKIAAAVLPQEEAVA
ncbi:toll/interleukin-1 receptor domain-containing protein [Agrococcus sp. Marseille-Q4369]|uniref:toll/interleukin-1 receptor domain-containing protein n=1 Tax=Agrococcus sp. Marseille-Q4369 TaxID=2810513 RepID=UPI001B8CE82F|nr:toll/interleukin-1 receptor domain-containing protein [Agrococcus sp. Marseille-Q4369]QUW18185.1 toll/interleukin-1 receptor domain-containing protein [Agrococcus sp. Marseille-Q4369]